MLSVICTILRYTNKPILYFIWSPMHPEHVGHFWLLHCAVDVVCQMLPNVQYVCALSISIQHGCLGYKREGMCGRFPCIISDIIVTLQELTRIFLGMHASLSPGFLSLLYSADVNLQCIYVIVCIPTWSVPNTHPPLVRILLILLYTSQPSWSIPTHPRMSCSIPVMLRLSLMIQGNLPHIPSLGILLILLYNYRLLMITFHLVGEVH